jgi:hypothetical protein
MNIWYLVAKPDRRKKFRYRVITPFRKYHSTIESAVKEAKKYRYKTVILKRTCTPLLKKSK